mgnify:CR=1 FL=1
MNQQKIEQENKQIQIISKSKKEQKKQYLYTIFSKCLSDIHLNVMCYTMFVSII